MSLQTQAQPSARDAQDGVLVLRIDDPVELNQGPSEVYPQALYRSISRGPRGRVAVDLGAVDLLSSRGVRVLVNLKRRVEAGQGHLVLYRLRPYVLRQFRITNLIKHFAIADERPDAVDLLRSDPPL